MNESQGAMKPGIWWQAEFGLENEEGLLGT